MLLAQRNTYSPSEAVVEHTTMGDKALVIGISGCSSSGKTTLARLLRDIFPNAFILHEDDFYRAEEECVNFNVSQLEKLHR